MGPILADKENSIRQLHQRDREVRGDVEAHGAQLDERRLLLAEISPSLSRNSSKGPAVTSASTEASPWRNRFSRKGWLMSSGS